MNADATNGVDGAVARNEAVVERAGVRKAALIIAAAVVAALALGLAIRASMGGGVAAAEKAVYEVRRGPLQIRIAQSGELQAAESIRIIPGIKGQATIIELVDEGTRVSEGDVVARLDATDLETREATQAIELENAQAALIKAEQEKRIQELTNETDVAKARLAVDTARMELDKYGIVVLRDDGFLDMRYYPQEPEVQSAIDGAMSAAAQALAMAAKSGAPGTAGLEVAAVDTVTDAGAPSGFSRPHVPPSIESTAAPSVEGIGAPAVESTDVTAVPGEDMPAVESVGSLSVDSTGVDAQPVPGHVERGEAYQAFRDAELAIDKARTDLERAETDYSGMDKLVDRGFMTKNDEIAARLKRDEAKNALESAYLSHYILRTYTYPKTLEEKRAEFRKAEGELKKVELSAAAQMAQKDSDILQARAVFDMRKRALDETNDQLSKMVVTAPAGGFVLYGDERRPWEKEEIKIGGKAYEGRPLCTLPSITNMIAATRVQEKDIYKVKVDQAADVTIPALPGLTLKGKVTKISNVASGGGGRRWMAASETKVFDVEITLDDYDARMKPGMSCQADILIDTLPDRIYVPVNAVFRQDGVDYCNVVTGGRTAPQPVTLGEGNEIFVSVADGLEESQKVLLYNVATGETGSLGGRKSAAADEKGPASVDGRAPESVPGGRPGVAPSGAEVTQVSAEGPPAAPAEGASARPGQPEMPVAPDGEGAERRERRPGSRGGREGRRGGPAGGAVQGGGSTGAGQGAGVSSE